MNKYEICNVPFCDLRISKKYYKLPSGEVIGLMNCPVNHHNKERYPECCGKCYTLFVLKRCYGWAGEILGCPKCDK
jgi:hypothetical protein